jgi:hypothetical protein
MLIKRGGDEGVGRVEEAREQSREEKRREE